MESIKAADETKFAGLTIGGILMGEQLIQIQNLRTSK